MPTAIVTGATGILGRQIVHQLGANPQQWSRVWALSRSKKEDFPTNVKQGSIDLTGSAADMAKSLEGMAPEYVFFSAYLQQDSEEANTKVNGDMLQAFLEALEAAGASKQLKRIVLVTGCKQYGVHLGPIKNPMQETDPWLRDTRDFPPNFYYRQQDILAEYCEKTKSRTGDEVSWTVTYPNDVIGFARGNFMNLATSIGLYVAVSKELGGDKDGIVFPGSPRFYVGFDSLTSAKLHAEFCEWAALEPKAANQAFNVVNGDVESYQNLWPRMAARFGLKVKEDQFVGDAASTLGFEPMTATLQDKPPVAIFEREAGLKAQLAPGRLENRVDLVKWSQRDDVKQAWERLADREGLEKEAFDKATWGFLAFVLGRSYDMVISMSKARELGWTGYLDTWRSFDDTFNELEQAKILPKTTKQ